MKTPTINIVLRVISEILAHSAPQLIGFLAIFNYCYTVRSSQTKCKSYIHKFAIFSSMFIFLFHQPTCVINAHT